MRIGLVVYPLNSRGGVFRWLDETCNLLAEEHEMFVAAGGEVKLGADDFEATVDVVRLDSVRRNPLGRSGVTEVSQWASARSLDVIVGALPRADALVLRVATGWPTVVTLHGALPAGSRGAAYRLVFRRLGSRARAVGVVSDSLTNEATKLFRSSAAVSIPNAVARASSELGLDAERRGFVWVGRLESEKGVELLARAACRLGNPVLVLGDGSQASTLSAVAARGCVQLGGWVSDTRSHLSRAAVYLSTAPSEGMSYAFLDAVSCGCVPLVSAEAFGWLGLPPQCLYRDLDDLVSKGNELTRLTAEERSSLAGAAAAKVSMSHGVQRLHDGWRLLLNQAVNRR